MSKKGDKERRMRRVIVKAVALLMAVSIIAGCSSDKNKSEQVEPTEQTSQNNTKEVDIFGTKYTIPDDWKVDKIQESHNSRSVMVYMQQEKPEKIYNAIAITEVDNVLTGATEYSQSRFYIDQLSEDMRKQFFKGVSPKKITIENCDKPETAGSVIKGDNGEMHYEIYCFMNNKTNSVMINYYQNIKEGIDYSKEVKSMVDSMVFSDNMYTAPKPKSENKSKDTDKKRKTCIACHGTGKVEQYYTDDPLEKPHWETCALCHGKGYYYE